MDKVVILIAFGDMCLEQFSLMLPGLQQCGTEIVLITESDRTMPGVRCIKVPMPGSRAEMMAYRTRTWRLVRLDNYAMAWYMDTDIVIKKNLFAKYEGESLWLCAEPDQRMDNEHFSGLLSGREHETARRWPAINSGIVGVPRRSHMFWKMWEDITARAMRQRPWIAEQQALNWIYFHYWNRYRMRIMDRHDVGYPAKSLGGDYAMHYCCMKDTDKLNNMAYDIGKD